MKPTSCKYYLLGLLMMIPGCTLQHVPKEQKIAPANIPPFKVVGAVRLTNTQSSVEDVPLAIPGFTINVNYKSYTDIALKLLRSELDNKSGAVAGSAAKEIKVAIVDIKMLPMSGNFRCIVNYTVESGDGYIRGLEAIGGSWSYQTAIDTAVTNVAVGVLNEERILTYLEK
jgi:hypothetical protein